MRWAYVLVVLVPQVLAFFALRNVDGEVYVGATSIIKITQSDDSTDSPTVYASLAAIAHDGEFGIAREVLDRRTPDRVRHLYVTTGRADAPQTSWLTSGYPSFDRSIVTTVEPMGALGRTDPRGYYFVFGTSRDAVAVEHALSDMGLTGVRSGAGSFADQVLFARDEALVTGAAIATILAALLVASGTLLDGRRTGVQRLAGIAPLRSARRELGAVARTMAVAALSGGVTAVALFGYNGLAQSARYLTLTLTLTGIGTALVIVMHAASRSLVAGEPLGNVLRGSRPGRGAMWLLFAVRTPAAVLLVTATGGAVVATAQLDAFSTNESVRDAAAASVRVSVSGSISDTPDVWQRISAFAKDAERADQLIASWPVPLEQLSAGSAHGPTSPALVVNEAYLGEQTLRTSSGARVHGGADDIRVLVPERMAAQASGVAASVESWAHSLVDGSDAPARPVATMPLAAGQRVYTYATPGRQGGGNWLEDPIVIVMPELDAPRWVDDLASFVASGDVVFRDPDWVDAAIEQRGLSAVLIAMQPVAQAAADEEHRLAIEQRIAYADLAGAALVTILATVMTSTAHRRRFATEVFAKHAAGWTFVESNVRILAVELAVVCVGGFVALLTLLAQRSGPTTPDVPLDPVAAVAPTAFALTTAALAAAFTVGVATLSTTGRHAIRNHGRET